MAHFKFQPQGVCSSLIEIDTDNDIVTSVKFTGGCSGNLQGVSILSKGEKISTLIEKLEGVDCRGRGTSCPDQFTKALREIQKGGSL